MKATKALKRLTKIETLMTDVMERFSKGSPQIREALQDAKAALGRAMAAVSSQASSEETKTAKTPSKKPPEPAKRKLSPAGKQANEKGVHGWMAHERRRLQTQTNRKRKPLLPEKKPLQKHQQL
jgi:hypothetical protein